LVMSQDSLQRVANKWLTREYDSLNRVWRTTLLSDNNNRAFHQNLASNSNAYPNVSGGTFELLKQSYYDDYSWSFLPLTPTMDLSVAYNINYFYTTYNSSPAYAQKQTPFYQTRGLLTGEKDEEMLSAGGG